MAKKRKAIGACAPEFSIPGEPKKNPPTVRIGTDRWEKKIPIAGLDNLKVGQHVNVGIRGEVIGIRKDRSGESVEIEMARAAVGQKKEIEELLEDA